MGLNVLLPRRLIFRLGIAEGRYQYVLYQARDGQLVCGNFCRTTVGCFLIYWVCFTLISV